LTGGVLRGVLRDAGERLKSYHPFLIKPLLIRRAMDGAEEFISNRLTETVLAVTHRQFAICQLFTSVPSMYSSEINPDGQIDPSLDGVNDRTFR
jgi:hypothetical protein